MYIDNIYFMTSILIKYTDTSTFRTCTYHKDAQPFHIDKNLIPVSIQYIHKIHSRSQCHVHSFSNPTSLFTTCRTSSTSKHRICVQHRELQQPLAAAGDCPAPVQQSVGKDHHQAFPRRKALRFIKIKLATWQKNAETGENLSSLSYLNIRKSGP